jgi:hypothetical protein
VADGVDVEDVISRVLDSVAPPNVAPLQIQDPSSFTPSDREPRG